ncbi:MAG: hypothetical protein LBS62_09280 [Clostridiales bacterium]|nr:hypothetical protein [Clostridiales bacterium]
MNTGKEKYTVIWRLDGVEILRGEVVPEDKSGVIELRTFNEDSEYRCNKFGERRLTDGRPETPEHVDEIHKLWGNPANNKQVNGVTILTEDRGTVVKVPFEVPEGHNVFVKVRNYLSAADKPFEFTDWRFAEFITMEAEEAYGR